MSMEIVEVFSTHVEMNRLEINKSKKRGRFLYARGDEPFSANLSLHQSSFSLRTWR